MRNVRFTSHETVGRVIKLLLVGAVREIIIFMCDITV